MIPQADRRRLQTGGASHADPVRLLIADDDSGYCSFLSALARRLGFRVDIARDGAVALDRLANVPYDVAIIDLKMPQLTGLEVIAALRSGEAASSIYAVMLTAYEDVDTKVTALDAGFDDFVAKSSSYAELVAKLSAARRVAVRQRDLDCTIRELYGLATRDELTGVFNRRFFIAESERMLSEGASLSVVLFDLDGFKQVNDTHGHLAGDQVLRDVGMVFQKLTRPDDLVARYGGDEFVLVARSVGAADLERVAARLADGVRALRWMTDDKVFTVGVTSGCATSELLPEATLAALLDAADRDLYKNKWILQHPDQRPELYVYPVSERKIDLVLPLPAKAEGNAAGQRENGAIVDRPARRPQAR